MPPYNPAHKSADLTETQVVEIVGLLLSGKTLSYVAQQFGIEPQAAEDIRKGQYARHLRRDSRSSALNTLKK